MLMNNLISWQLVVVSYLWVADAAGTVVAISIAAAAAVVAVATAPRGFPPFNFAMAASTSLSTALGLSLSLTRPLLLAGAGASEFTAVEGAMEGAVAVEGARILLSAPLLLVPAARLPALVPLIGRPFDFDWEV